MGMGGGGGVLVVAHAMVTDRLISRLRCGDMAEFRAPTPLRLTPATSCRLCVATRTPIGATNATITMVTTVTALSG